MIFYFYENGHHCVRFDKKVEKHPKLYFFTKKEDALEWIRILENRNSTNC